MSARQRATGLVRIMIATAWIYLGVVPAACISALAEERLDARDLIKRGTLEAGATAGFWQAFNPGDVESANRSSVFVLPRIGMVVSNEFQAGLLSGNIELFAEPFFARFTQPVAAEAAGAR